MKSVKRLLATFAVALIMTATIGPARAQDAPSLIRDDEIENTIRGWVEPEIRAAGMTPSAVKIILVQSSEINAFVAGGQNVFVYTGLLMKSENAQEVIGVISHELGHIAGGHLIRGREAMANASFEAMLGALVGIGAAVLSGNAGAGATIGMGATGMASGSFLSFSRVQESSADQAGLSFMNEAHVNPEGLVSFMQKLESEELLPSSQQSEYVRTHPLTRNRIEALQSGLDRSPWKDKAPDPAWAEQHARLKAKLTGFINPEQVAWNYGDRDQSVAARYARTIAAYRQNDTDKALRGMDDLLKTEPGNPYFAELKGQMLVDFSKVGEALTYYKSAVAKLPHAGLIRIAYAHAMMEAGSESDPASLRQAIDQLERATDDEPRSILAQRLLATAYGRLGNEPVAKLHLAEESLLKGDRKDARAKAESALPGLKKGSSQWLRANDLLSSTDNDDDPAPVRRRR